MHIFLASFAQLTGLSVNISIKILLAIVSGISPFILYFLINHSLDENSKRFILIATCFTLPFASVIFGTTFALPLYFLFIAIFLRQSIFEEASRKFSLVLIIIATGLIFSHGVTPLFLTILMFCTPVVLKIVDFLRKEKSSFNISKYLRIELFLSIFLLSWWISTSNYLFSSFLVQTIRSIFSTSTSAISIPSAFIGLSLSEQITLLYIRFYQLFIIGALSLLGLILYFIVYRKRYPKRAKDLYLQVICILVATVIISIPFLFNLQGYTFERFIVYSKVLAPLFIGLSLLSLSKYFKVHINRKILQKFFYFIFLLLLFIPLLFVVYTPQPLIPKNSEGEYIVDYRSVNVAGPLNERVDYRTPAKLDEFKFNFGNNVIYDNGESFMIVTIK
ncbi:MAG: hypothetical protein P8Y18_09905 [Candidatus Bathyarchaeota archaeon]